ncbi:MAG: VOC family protein [Anaerolineales bacterium]|nr:VOC family protein [Anaerolineales bacterium]
MGHAHPDHDHSHAHDHAHPHAHAHPEVDPNHVEFIGGRPILRVANVAAALAYYTQQLGFAVGFEWAEGGGLAGGAAPTHAEVRRGHVVLQFSQTQGAPGTWLYLDLESRAELAKLHAEYTASGARIVEPPSDKPWGMVEMRVEDLDGNVFRVGAPQGFERA